MAQVLRGHLPFMEHMKKDGLKNLTFTRYIEGKRDRRKERVSIHNVYMEQGRDNIAMLYEGACVGGGKRLSHTS